MNQYGDMKRKVYSLLNKTEKLKKRLTGRDADIKNLCRILRNVVRLVPYDAPEIDEARKELERHKEPDTCFTS